MVDRKKNSSMIEPLHGPALVDAVESGGADPRFCEIVETISKETGNKARAFRVRYAFGDRIVKDGTFLAPESCSPEDSQELLSSLRYSEIPLCLVLSKAIEVFRETTLRHAKDPRFEHSYSYPKRIITSGTLFGLFEVADYLSKPPKLNDSTPLEAYPRPATSKWSITAGSRTIRILAPLEDKDFLKALNVSMGTSFQKEIQGPMWSYDHWWLIRQVVRNHAELNEWQAEVLVFPSDWIDGTTVAHRQLHKLVLTQAWTDSAWLRSASLLELDLMNAMDRKVEDDAIGIYKMRMLRHLIDVGRGGAVAFGVASEDNSETGPWTQIQQCLKKWLELRRQPTLHYPVILIPIHMSDRIRTAYLSLNLPTIEGHTPGFGMRSSTSRGTITSGLAIPLGAVLKEAGALQESGELKIDQPHLSKTTVFVTGESGLPNISEDASELATDFIPPDERKWKLSTKDAFFQGAVRIHRKK